MSSFYCGLLGVHKRMVCAIPERVSVFISRRIPTRNAILRTTVDSHLLSAFFLRFLIALAQFPERSGANTR